MTMAAGEIRAARPARNDLDAAGRRRAALQAEADARVKLAAPASLRLPAQCRADRGGNAAQFRFVEFLDVLGQEIGKLGGGGTEA